MKRYLLLLILAPTLLFASYGVVEAAHEVFSHLRAEDYIKIGGEDTPKIVLEKANGGRLVIYEDNNTLVLTDLGGGRLDLSDINGEFGVGIYGDRQIYVNAPNGATRFYLDGSTSQTELIVVMPLLPTSDPAVSGQLWNDNGTLKVSQ